MKRNQETTPSVAVIGAAGYTGRFVVRELLRRGIRPIAIVRDPAAFTGFPHEDLPVYSASIDDPASLDKALSGASAVIHCAGPFLETGDAVVAAALRGGLHYLDLSAEQTSVTQIFNRYDSAASTAGVTVLPGMAFYGGFADLLVAAAMGDWPQADAVDVMMGMDRLYPTRGTRLTGAKNTVPRVVLRHGQLAPAPAPPTQTDWNFPPPIGHQAMMEIPFSETILMARQAKVAELHTWISRNALNDVGDPATPAPQPADASGRSAQRFVVEAVVRQAGQSRRITASGQDIYAFSASLICEAAERLIHGRDNGAGVQAPSAIFDAKGFLDSLSPEPLTFQIAEA